MYHAIGMVELNSIAKGIEVTDVMLKSANVTLLSAKTLCPGKYLIMVGGDVTAMQAADLEAKPANRLSEIDLGSVPPDTVAPPVEEKGFFGNMMETLGL